MKLKQEPKLIYYSLTHEFELEKEDGSTIKVRKYEDKSSGGTMIYNPEIEGWIEIYDRDLLLEIEEVVEDFDFFKLY
jgi:hypothetical protein